MTLIGNYTSKSEALIQSETAFNTGETVNCSMDRLDAIHRKEYKDDKFKTKTSVSRRIRIAQIWERCHSLLQYCNVVQIARLVFYKAIDPTLHYKMMADEVYDRSGGRVATPIQTNRNWMSRRGCRL